MQMMMVAIETTKGEKKHSTLWFNAWMYEGRERLTAFAATRSNHSNPSLNILKFI